MDIKELKQRVGEQARDIIASGLNLEHNGKLYDCPYKDHKKGKTISAQWFNEGFHFHCFNCGRNFDLSDYASTIGDRMEVMHRLANVEYKKIIIPSINPIVLDRTKQGIDYLHSRGIGDDTIEKYKITCDSNWIYFNYYMPDNSLVKIKQRKLGYCKNGTDKYTAPTGGSLVLYGMHMLKNHKAIAICEGEVDSLSLYECAKLCGKEDLILCTSIPNGTQAMGWIENCKQYLDQFDCIILIPDSDDAGNKFLEKAKELLSEYNLASITLPVKDVNEYLLSPDYNPAEIFKLIKPYKKESKAILCSKNVGLAKVQTHVSTGFVTWDYNDCGFTMGNVSLLTGFRGEGKTTVARQTMISMAKQKVKSFVFIGEANVEDEKNKLSRLCASSDEIIKTYNMGGKELYTASDNARKRFDEKYAEFIMFSDCSNMRSVFPEIKKDSKKMFDHLLNEMETVAKYNDVKVFIIDNLMVLCSGSGNVKFTMQEKIISSLKEFANKFNVHVCLIAHPKAGAGLEKISGSQDIENLSDSIFRYVRVFDSNRETILKPYKLEKEIKDRVSALLFTEKVRNDGARNITFFEWDNIHGAVYDISTLRKAKEYEDKGYWTKAIGRFTEHDQPKYKHDRD